MAWNGSVTTTAISMSFPRFERVRRGLLPAACLVAPKCVLCAFAFAGVGTTLGLNGPELCGGTATTTIEPASLGGAAAATILVYRLIRPATP